MIALVLAAAIALLALPSARARFHASRVREGSVYYLVDNRRDYGLMPIGAAKSLAEMGPDAWPIVVERARHENESGEGKVFRMLALAMIDRDREVDGPRALPESEARELVQRTIGCPDDELREIARRVGRRSWR